MNLESAMQDIPSSIIPIKGLRRDGSGALTMDAIQTIMDGFRSRGIQIYNQDVRDSLLYELYLLYSRLEKQYQYLLRNRLKYIDKQQRMQDILQIVRHLAHVNGAKNAITR
jgi:hypothetical protein